MTHPVFELITPPGGPRVHMPGFTIPAWYINKFTIIDFTIYTPLFPVKLKSVVDGPIFHSKSVVDGSILHCKAKVY